MKYFDADLLIPVMVEVLARHGAAPESVGHVVKSVVQTSLRGIDSHGINLFPHYCRAVQAGRVNGRPAIAVERTGASAAIVEADHAFGHHAGAVAMKEAIAMAKESGMGAVSVRNSTHFGAAGYFGLMAPAHDCLGFAFTNADALVKAFGSAQAFFGTNPICFTAPLEKEEPLCLDMATSLVSWNKINNYRREEMSLPDGWAFDENGCNVNDPHLARSLNPAGGYKGFGLGMMVDILCATLAGGLMSKDVKAMYAPPLDAGKRCLSHFFMALDISRFLDPQLFRKNLQGMVDRVRSLPPMEEAEAVMVPGDPEKKAYARRMVEGIPVDDAKLIEFLDVSSDFKKALLP